jgi:hypothetical protein
MESRGKDNAVPPRQIRIGRLIGRVMEAFRTATLGLPELKSAQIWLGGRRVVW